MKKGWFISGILTFVLIAAGVGGVFYYGNDKTLPKGFEVSGLKVEGLSAEESIGLLQAQLDRLKKVKITVIPPKVSETDDGSLSEPARTLEQLGMHIDAADAVKAIEQFRDASWWDRAFIRYQNELKSQYDIQVTWDDTVFNEEATSSWGSIAGVPPKAATREINDQDEVVYTPEVIGTELDTSALLVSVKSFEPKSLSLSSVSSGGDGHGDGREIRIELPVILTEPEVTVAKLKEEGIERKIVEFTTDFSSSGEGRSHNVTAAAKALNETLLMPDEVFEYGKIVAKAEKEYGYKEAPVILKGKLTPGIGGGICQVSSTLYNAALLTGLDIVERRNHSLVVSYLPKGLDATFADGYVNFKFRNSTGKQLLIRTVVVDKKVTVKLFGTMPDNVTYRTETEQVKENPPKIVYVANDKLVLGKQDVLQKGSPGYVVESYLIKMIDGDLAERKKLSKDTYRSQDTLIAVNPNDPRLKSDGDKTGPSESPAPSGDAGDSNGPVEPI